MKHLPPTLITAAVAFVVCIFYGYLKTGSPSSTTASGPLNATLP